MKWCRRTLFHLLRPFFSKVYYEYYSKQIEALSENTQLFFLGRNDFGTQLHTLHYAKLWSENRGPVAIAVFTDDFLRIQVLAKGICPKAQLILPKSARVVWPMILFGSNMIRWYIFKEVYPQIALDRPDGLNIFALFGLGYGCYSTYLDDNLSNIPSHFSSDFIKAYCSYRTLSDCRMNVFYDYFSMAQTYRGEKVKTDIDLEKHLGYSQPFLVLNVNAKKYLEGKSNVRSVHTPQRYNSMIDHLISRGFSVVIQGRSEQPQFASRKGLFDYARSPYCSYENDLQLFANCAFAILNKTGPAVFAAICDIPLLGLNYVDLLSTDPFNKLRFYPKYYRDRETGNILSWQEHLQSPAFFNIGGVDFCNSRYEYVEMAEEEIMESVKEFLPLLELSDKEWWSYSKKQQEFKESLHPLHCDLYQAVGVPLDSYLHRSEELSSLQKSERN